MEGGAYIAALLRLCHHSSEAVIRRALKLITTSIAKLGLQEQPKTEVSWCLPAAGHELLSVSAWKGFDSQCCVADVL